MPRLRLNWTASASASGYLIEAGLVSGTYTVTRDVGTALDSFLDVPIGGRWNAVVTPYDATHTSGAHSQEVVVEAETPLFSPLAVF